jgi:F-type H+-transporting ATPase subunit b
MDEILKQLVELVIGSVPTMVIFLLLLAAYSLLVHGPLQRTLAERRARTSGAVENAKTAIAKAAARTAEYQTKLLEARVALLRSSDHRVKQWQSESDAVLESVRETTREQVAKAITEIEKSVEVARQQVEQLSEQLAAQVAQAVLSVSGPPTTGRTR